MPAAKRPARKAKPSTKAKPVSSKAKARSSARKPAVKAAAKSASKPVKKKASAKPAKAVASKRTPVKKAAKTATHSSPAPTVRASSHKTVSSARKQPSRPKAEPSYEYDPNALIHGIRPYKAKAGEGYMNANQLEHFRQVLLAWKRELMEEVDRTVHHMQDEASNFPDPNDRATQESEFGLELRTRDRERKLLKKISSALARIDDNSYGYCEETGEEIGLKRLEARPVATLCLEAQERRELAEKQYGERDDRHR